MSQHDAERAAEQLQATADKMTTTAADIIQADPGSPDHVRGVAEFDQLDAQFKDEFLALMEEFMPPGVAEFTRKHFGLDK